MHLHAHDSLAREQEALRVADAIRPLLARAAQVVLMGDFNSLSPLDSLQHEGLHLKSVLGRTDQSMFNRLRKKYCDSSNNINYEPINHIQATGLQDACFAGTECQENRNFILNCKHFFLW